MNRKSLKDKLKRKNKLIAYYEKLLSDQGKIIKKMQHEIRTSALDHG